MKDKIKYSNNNQNQTSQLLFNNPVMCLATKSSYEHHQGKRENPEPEVHRDSVTSETLNASLWYDGKYPAHKQIICSQAKHDVKENCTSELRTSKNLCVCHKERECPLPVCRVISSAALLATSAEHLFIR